MVSDNRPQQLLNSKANDKQTMLEFIRESEQEFGLSEKDLSNISLFDLLGYINFLDYLWTK